MEGEDSGWVGNPNPSDLVVSMVLITKTPGEIIFALSSGGVVTYICLVDHTDEIENVAYNGT